MIMVSHGRTGNRFAYNKTGHNVSALHREQVLNSVRPTFLHAV
ncbi:hypothetical protein QFZ35_002957 [Arthrobacter ulcerisalmonis]|nr:hypothetical protein [Arthrobacter ulcerisalmonis]MDQ0732376.1 hypothetical protein [Arthrobacter sp. B1I2]